MFKSWHTPQYDTVKPSPSANNDNNTTTASSSANYDAVKTIKGFKFTFRCVYLLLIASFVLHVFQLYTLRRQSADTSGLEAFLKSDVASQEVEMIVQNYLNRIKLSDQDMSSTTTTTATTKVTQGMTEEKDLDDNHVKSEYEYR
jgi:hypothetical protein